MLVAGKRKHNHKTCRKCQALEDMEKGMSNKDVSAKEHFINLGQKQRNIFRFTRKRKQD